MAGSPASRRRRVSSCRSSSVPRTAAPSGIGAGVQSAGFRYLLTALLLLALAAVNGLRALARPGMLEVAARYADERDRFLVLQASRTALGLLNGLLTAGCFAALVLYGALRRPELLAVGLTLCAVLVLLFILVLAAECWHERRG